MVAPEQPDPDTAAPDPVQSSERPAGDGSSGAAYPWPSHTLMAMLLVRHGTTTQDLPDHDVLDFDDTPLTSDGYRRAITIGTQLAPAHVPVVFTSDCRRSVETATPWAVMGQAQVSAAKVLRPWDRRGLIGLGEKEVGKLLEYYVRNPTATPIGGGETFAQYCARFVPFVWICMTEPGLMGMITHSTGARTICALVAQGLPVCPDTYLSVECLKPGQAAFVTATR